MKVLLTTGPGTHAAYAQTVAAPPPGVEFVWTTAPPASPRRYDVARRVFRALRLPNVRIAQSAGEFDLIHSCQHLLLTRRRWVVDIEHGQPFVSTDFSRLSNRLTRAAILAILRMDECRAILPWTRTAADAFIATLQPDRRIVDKIRVVYPAVAAPADVQPRDGDECRLLFVANKPAYNAILKGGREVVDAFKAVRERGARVSLAVVGPVSPELESRCRNVPGVVMTGPVARDQLNGWYTRSDIYVMPSFSDTFGMVYLEAMAHGLPVVAFDRPFTREIVRDGKTGLLVPMSRRTVHWSAPDGRLTMNSDRFIAEVLSRDPDPEVVQSLASAVRRLVGDVGLRQQLGAGGREEVLSGRFSLINRQRALEEVYLAALGCQAQ